MPGSGTCVVSKPSWLQKFFWIPLMLNEALLLILAFIKGARNLTTRGHPNSIVGEMVKDSALYFFVCVDLIFPANTFAHDTFNSQHIPFLIHEPAHVVDRRCKYAQHVWNEAANLFITQASYQMIPVGLSAVINSVMSQKLLINVRRYQFGVSYEDRGQWGKCAFGVAARPQIPSFNIEMSVMRFRLSEAESFGQ